MIKITREDHLAGEKNFPMVDFQLAGKTYKLFIDDEYEDLRYNYPLLNFCLVLRELDGYDAARELEVWAQERYLDAKDSQVIKFHQYLAKIYPEIAQILGKIHPHISDWDFEMNAGAAQQLRKSD